MALSKVQGAQIESPVDISAVNLTGVTTAARLVGTAVSVTAGGLVVGIATVNNINTTQLNVTGVTTATQLNVGTGGTVITTTSAGKVGILSTSPQSDLHIGIGSFKVGTASTQSFIIEESSPGLDGGLKVGINTGISQNYKLHVLDEHGSAAIYGFSNHDASVATWSGRVVASNINSTSNKSVFLGVYRDTPAIAAHAASLSTWQTLWINGVSLGGGDQGGVVIPGHTGIGSTTLTHRLNITGTAIYSANLLGGTGSSSKSLAQGDIALDNGGTDTPGILFYYDDNHNFGIDSSKASQTGGTGGHLRIDGDDQFLRFIYKLNQTGGFTVAGVSSSYLAAKEYVGLSTLGATMNIKSINTGPVTKNYFYNSSFIVDARHESVASISAPYGAVGSAVTYTADRWYLYPGGASVTHQRQNTDIIGDTNPYSYDINGAAGVTFIDFAQRLESIDTAYLAAKDVTVSAYVKNTAGITTMSIELAYPNSLNNFSGETIIANKVVPISGTTSRIAATFENLTSNVNKGMSVRFRIHGLTSGVFSIACPQLEVGKVASEWGTVDAATEVNRCKRYCQAYNSSGAGTRLAVGNWSSNAAIAYVTMSLNNQMRTVPSIYWIRYGKCLIESISWYDVGGAGIVETSWPTHLTLQLTGITTPNSSSTNANATWGNGAGVILSSEL